MPYVYRPRRTPEPTNRLHILRALKNLRTQGQAADYLGIKRPRYWRIEAGISYPTDDELEVIEARLGPDHGLGRPPDRVASTDRRPLRRKPIQEETYR